MPTPDDEQFERYLKQFQPNAPDALPASVHEPRTWNRWRLSAALAAAVALIVLAVLMVRNRPQHTVPEIAQRTEGPTHIAGQTPLTMRNANKLLADAPSFKSVVDDLAFRSQQVPLASNQQSAVYVLGMEKIKL